MYGVAMCSKDQYAYDNVITRFSQHKVGGRGDSRAGEGGLIRAVTIDDCVFPRNLIFFSRTGEGISPLSNHATACATYTTLSSSLIDGFSNLLHASRR